MKVAIEVNGVLRNTIGKIEQTYQKFLIDKTEGMENDELFKYEMNLPITSLDLTKHFSFQNEEEYYSFLFEEFPMEIFGHAQSAEYSTFPDLNELYLNLRNNIDLYIISDEIGKSKPATLFFLSKFGCLFEKIIFYSNSTKESIINDFDIVVTSNPDLLIKLEEKVIKYETEYNKDISVSNTVKTIKELEIKLKELC